MQSAAELKSLLNRIDHKGYPAYKDTKGIYQFQGYELSIDHVQGDPFASPSKVSVRVRGRQAAFPKELYKERHQRVALQDELTRQFGRRAERFAFKAKGSGKSGLISVSRCGQEVLERTACRIDERTGDVTLRMEIGFPANGRTINARELEKILFEFVPECVRYSLFYKNMNEGKLREIIDLAEDQHYIREMLSELGLCAFVANGSILPRESGISAKPMRGGVKFISSKEQEVTLELPHKGKLTGMGIKKGITLIVGGGYHGKSTLLKALELGVYDHIAGDGREYVITDASALKLRAEDGRSIQKTDISMFINDLPNGKDTVGFCTEDASGSTSQAANVVEGIEAGTKLLLIDEDTSATNFMIRDELMQRVIHREMEPITPFIERIRELYEEYDISTVIVAGSSGAYFHIADSVIQMDRYMPKDITGDQCTGSGCKATGFQKMSDSKPGIKKRRPCENESDGMRGGVHQPGHDRSSLCRTIDRQRAAYYTWVLYPLCTEADHRWKKDAARDCRGTGKDTGQRRAGGSEWKWFKCAMYGNAEETGDFRLL